MRKEVVYKAKRFDLSGLKGISDRTLEMHFKLYEGYVANSNMLNERIGEFLEKGPISQAEMPVYSELTRRLGFEYNGMVLHEHYFGNLMKNGSGGVTHNSAFFQWATLEPLDYVARRRQRRGVHPGAGDGCVGACLPARLYAGRAAEIHRGFLRQRSLGCCRETLDKKRGFAPRRCLIPDRRWIAVGR